MTFVTADIGGGLKLYRIINLRIVNDYMNVYSYKLLSSDGSSYHGYILPSTIAKNWKFHIGSTAELLTILFGSRYKCNLYICYPMLTDTTLERTISKRFLVHA